MVTFVKQPRWSLILQYPFRRAVGKLRIIAHAKFLRDEVAVGLDGLEALAEERKPLTCSLLDTLANRELEGFRLMSPGEKIAETAKRPADVGFISREVRIDSSCHIKVGFEMIGCS